MSAYLWVALLGAFVAAGELVSRYRDDPVRAVLSWPAVVYLGVNSGTSVAALVLVRSFGWTFGADSGQEEVRQVLVAGFGAIALFRSSLFNVTVGNQVMGIGPSVILNVILTAADRAVDRGRAKVRIAAVADAMKDMPFAFADSFRLFCFESMQNTDSRDADRIAATLRELRDDLNAGVPEPVKSLVFGLALLNVVGEEVITEASVRLFPYAKPPPGAGATSSVH